MHELSVAMSIVDIALDHARKASAERITQVELDIGTLSGIEYTSLEFALEVATRDTLLEKATFQINRIEPLAECHACLHRFQPGGVFGRCPLFLCPANPNQAYIRRHTSPLIYKSMCIAE